MNKYAMFFTCLAPYLPSNHYLAAVLDQIAANPSAPAVIDMASDDSGPIGPARMAQQVVNYTANPHSVKPAWLKALD